MSGHSKWATIKRKKAAVDAQRGRIFTRLIREITIAARLGGGDEEANPRLRQAIMAAKQANMPMENIKKAIARGTGELEGVSYEEYTYEGYAPGGVAVLMHVMTDNKNRTVSEIRHLMSKYGGNLGQSGSVAWMFKKKGSITIKKGEVSEDDLLMIAMDAGAEDLLDNGDTFELITDPSSYEAVCKALDENGIKTESRELSMVPQTTVKISDPQLASQVLKLMEALEEHDDMQNVYANFDIDDDVLAALEK